MNGGEKPKGAKGFLLGVLHALRPGISIKIPLYFLAITLVPLLTVSYVLVNAANNQLQKDVTSKQQAVADDLSRRVDNYLANDVNLLTFEARLYSAHGMNMTGASKNLNTLFNQNANLQQITLLTTSGNQQTLTLQNGKIATANSTLSDASSSNPLAFMVNKPYFMSVGRDTQNNPQIAIGIPILKKYGQPSSGLFATPSGSSANIAGAFVGYFNVSDLWDSVLSASTGNGEYAYVVDGNGNLVTHPNRGFLDSHRQLSNTQAVHQFITGNDKTKFATKQTVSETNQEVISTPRKTVTGWAVIVEEPVTSTYASINSFIKLSATVGISAVVLSLLAGLFFSQQLIRPIRALSMGAKRIERGEFGESINVKTKDELQELADTFNRMAVSIKRLINDMQSNNLRLKFEQIKLSNIISSVSDGIVAVDSKGQIVSVNPPAAQIVNQAPDTLEGKLISEVFPWEHDGSRFMPDFTMGGIYRYADLALNRGDTVVYMDVMVAVLAHQDTDVAAIITIHDQTASRELSFMKLDFVAIAAHELRTPLTVVRGFLDMVNTDAVNQLSIANLENLHKAMDGADQLRQLINKLLNIARIERGDMEIFPEKLNLTKFVSENVDQHIATATQKEQVISYSDNTKTSVYVPADPASIVEVLNNLIGNALKYTGKGGRIKVNLIAGQNDVRVEVSDNGPGVPDELRERLFTKFYRAERSLIAGSRGTGLGLFISKTIIELQKGTIGIEPDKGTGSTFYFTLPIYDPARDDEIIAEKASGGIRGWFKKRTSSRG